MRYGVCDFRAIETQLRIRLEFGYLFYQHSAELAKDDELLAIQLPIILFFLLGIRSACALVPALMGRCGD